MCGRFGSSFLAPELQDRFDISEKPPLFKSSFNIAPSYSIPVVTHNSPNRAVLMRWGFLPVCADPKKFKLHPINARDDKLFESGFYKKAITDDRCIIPFSWFYEWHKFRLEDKVEKQPYLIRVKGEKIMGFAGIYSKRDDAEGKPYYTCAIITTKPNELMKKIHNRMPVILHKKDEDEWLDKKTNIKKVKELLKPYEANKMESLKISKLVNSPKNDGEELLKPIKN